MGTPRSTRTAGQNRRMHGLVGQLAKATGSTRDEAKESLRRHCREVSGQEHSSRLSRYQANQVIQRLEVELAGQRTEQQPDREPWGQRGPGPRAGQNITSRQTEVLQALFQQAGMGDRKRQMVFAKRQCKAPWPQTQHHYDQICEALKAIILRTTAASDAWRRAKALRGRAELDDWKRHFIADLCRQFEHAADDDAIDTVLTPHKLAKLVEAEAWCLKRAG